MKYLEKLKESRLRLDGQTIKQWFSNLKQEDNFNVQFEIGDGFTLRIWQTIAEDLNVRLSKGHSYADYILDCELKCIQEIDGSYLFSLEGCKTFCDVFPRIKEYFNGCTETFLQVANEKFTGNLAESFLEVAKGRGVFYKHMNFFIKSYLFGHEYVAQINFSDEKRLNIGLHAIFASSTGYVSLSGTEVGCDSNSLLQCIANYAVKRYELMKEEPFIDSANIEMVDVYSEPRVVDYQVISIPFNCSVLSAELESAIEALGFGFNHSSRIAQKGSEPPFCFVKKGVHSVAKVKKLLKGLSEKSTMLEDQSLLADLVSGVKGKEKGSRNCTDVLKQDSIETSLVVESNVSVKLEEVVVLPQSDALGQFSLF